MNNYIYKNKRHLALSLPCSFAASMFAVFVQFLKGDVLDLVLAGSLNDSLIKAGLLGLFILLEIGFYYLYDRARGRFTVEAIKDVRHDFFNSLISRSYPSFLKMTHGEYLAKYTNEMEILENQFFATIPMLAEILIKILLVSVSIFILDFRIALITIFLLTTPLYVPKLVEKHLQNAQTDYVEQFEENLKLLNDWLKGFEIIKNFSIENKISERFNQSNKHCMYKNLRKRQLGYLAQTISAILSYLSHYIILAAAAYLVLKGEFTAGKFFIAVGMIDQLSYPIISLSYFIQDLVSAAPVNRSIADFINPQKPESTKGRFFLEDIQTIVFSDVSFAYEDRTVLHNLSMTFEKGKCYLLSGPSGSGKTTGINLLLNYYDVNEGEILLDGCSVDEVKNLNELIAVMRQDAVFFKDSLRNNLSMYREISDEKLIDILNAVGLEKFADKENLDSLIEEDGVNFSGGEKRRLALARALLKQAPVLILDEPLANLDEKNAASVEDLILSIRGRILIVISHQFSESKLSQFENVYSF